MIRLLLFHTTVFTQLYCLFSHATSLITWFIDNYSYNTIFSLSLLQVVFRLIYPYVQICRLYRLDTQSLPTLLAVLKFSEKVPEAIHI